MKNAVGGLGLAPDAAMITFPIELFLPGSDIAPLEARRQEFYEGLTRWKSELAAGEPGGAPMLSVEGTSYEDALTRANHLLLTSLWGDGLPLWPATRERVDWILRGTPLIVAPVQLVQGGLGVIQRNPVFLPAASSQREIVDKLWTKSIRDAVNPRSALSNAHHLEPE